MALTFPKHRASSVWWKLSHSHLCSGPQGMNESRRGRSTSCSPWPGCDTVTSASPCWEAQLQGRLGNELASHSEADFITTEGGGRHYWGTTGSPCPYSLLLVIKQLCISFFLQSEHSTLPQGKPPRVSSVSTSSSGSRVPGS